MKKKSILVVMILLGITLGTISCTQQTKKGNSTRVIEPNTASEKTYQTITKELQTQKAIIIKHENTYNETLNNSTGSIMDKRDSQDAAKEIVKESYKLLELANTALKNEQVINSVSGGKNQISSYKTFAEEKIKKYE